MGKALLPCCCRTTVITHMRKLLALGATWSMSGGYETMEDFLRQAKYPLIRSCDMPPDLKEEVLDICLTSVEKHPSDYEKCTQTIKDTLDKKVGGSWQVVAGQSFSFEVTHKLKALQYLFVQGNLGVLVWKP